MYPKEMHTCGPKDAYKNVHSSNVHNCQYWKNPNVQQNNRTGGIFIEWNKYNSDNEWIISTCNYMYDSQQIMMRWKEANTKAFTGQMIYLWFSLYNVQKQSKQYMMAEFRVKVTPEQGVVAGRGWEKGFPGDKMSMRWLHRCVHFVKIHQTV